MVFGFPILMLFLLGQLSCELALLIVGDCLLEHIVFVLNAADALFEQVIPQDFGAVAGLILIIPEHVGRVIFPALGLFEFNHLLLFGYLVVYSLTVE